jgi:threonine dehydrogenase-like Zn-dependent dehydrogenase
LPNDDALAVAILIEPLANATHALDLAIDKVDPPRRVGVIGAGTLGFLTAFSAVTQGVPEVVISDLSAQRRSLAGASGAHLVVENLEGEFDVIVDAVGTDTTRAASVELVRPGGAAAWVGLHATRSAVDGLDVIRAEKRIVGSFCYHERDVTTAVGLLSTLDSAWIARRPLEDGVETFLRLASGDHSALKTALVAGGAS